MRVAFVNMSQSGVTCPQGLTQRTLSGLTLCGRMDGNYVVTTPFGGGCQSTVFSTLGLSYSQVCGQLRGYHFVSRMHFGCLHIKTLLYLLIMLMLMGHLSRMVAENCSLLIVFPIFERLLKSRTSLLLSVWQWVSNSCTAYTNISNWVYRAIDTIHIQDVKCTVVKLHNTVTVILCSYTA